MIAENSSGQGRWAGPAGLSTGDRAVISIVIASSYRAHGFGTALIRLATNRAFVHHRVAFVDAFIQEPEQGVPGLPL